MADAYAASPSVARRMLAADVFGASSPPGRRLPQLEPVPFGVDCPSEAAERRLPDLIDHLHSGRAQLSQHRIEVIDSIVDHARLVTSAEVAGVRREHRPGR